MGGFPETICDIAKVVKKRSCACSRDIIIQWCELLICPIYYHYKMCSGSKYILTIIRKGDISFFTVNMNFDVSSSCYHGQ